jgi:hypothetical protein
MIHDGYGNRRFYGMYRGVVAENQDPRGEFRLKLKIPQVLHDQISDWAWAIHQPGVTRSIPKVGTGVWVTFEGGDPSYPIWTGTFNTASTGDFPTSSLNYGSFQGTSTQAISATTPTPLNVDYVDESNNVRIVDSNKMYIDVIGTYNIQFSIQLSSTGTGVHDVYIWLARNGVAVGGAAGVITVPARKNASVPGSVVAGWNYVLTVGAGEYFQLIAEAESDSASVISAKYTAPGELNSHAIGTQTITTGTQYNATTGITRLTLGTSATFTIGETVYISGVVPTTYNGAWITQTGTTGTDLYIKTNSNLGSVTNSGVVSEIPDVPSVVITVTQIK